MHDFDRDSRNIKLARATNLCHTGGAVPLAWEFLDGPWFTELGSFEPGKNVHVARLLDRFYRPVPIVCLDLFDQRVGSYYSTHLLGLGLGSLEGRTWSISSLFDWMTAISLSVILVKEVAGYASLVVWHDDDVPINPTSAGSSLLIGKARTTIIPMNLGVSWDWGAGGCTFSVHLGDFDFEFLAKKLEEKGIRKRSNASHIGVIDGAWLHLESQDASQELTAVQYDNGTNLGWELGDVRLGKSLGSLSKEGLASSKTALVSGPSLDEPRARSGVRLEGSYHNLRDEPLNQIWLLMDCYHPSHQGEHIKFARIDYGQSVVCMTVESWLDTLINNVFSAKELEENGTRVLSWSSD
ncbi:hydantoin utilization protein a [Moniliophthora roreri]|nr:hydantoin utilization protein a [Moniliophthora roreri]